ncbi:hypothetical protein H480_32963 [Amycolatopsis vancoresmycina DSM 44592]|uniref:Membrane-associated oxidoreductase n=1 Tax=Amycolatopsis vancoresmycina DSM 44592 TaxID=1292037 RepID=R1I165_9PSEU|nr:hypothetical protein H480_32963 [Amycolatopsis vancoresmycina DSM 44592]
MEAARTGEKLVCDGEAIRARLIRELLLGWYGPVDPGGIRVSGARITGVLDLDSVTACAGAKLTGCLFADPVTAWNAHLPWLDLSRSWIPGLSGDLLNVEAGLWLTGAVIVGSGKGGAVALHGARITGSLDLHDAQVGNTSGAAVRAVGLEVSGSVLMSGADLSGSSFRGAVQLSGAHIGGSLALRSAKITNNGGGAVRADQLRVEGVLDCRGVKATGDHFGGAISLLGAHVGGDASFLDMEVVNRSGLALDLEHAQVVGKIFLVRSTVCAEADADSVCRDPVLVDLNGFKFGALEASPGQPVSWRDWLHLIRHHTEIYRPGPYQALASAERDAGHEGNVRRILIAQQKDLRRRAPEALGNWLTRSFHWLWGVLAGYGYLTRRTALALLLALMAAGGLGAWAGHVTDGGHHVGERVSSFGSASGRPCTTVELVGLGLDRGLPLAPTGVRARCDLNPDTTWAAAFTIAIWILQAAIWGLATLALAGYTGLIRKPT